MSNEQFRFPIMETVNGIDTVTSLQISNLVEKRHSQVLRDLRKLRASLLEIGNPPALFNELLHEVGTGHGATRKFSYFQISVEVFELLLFGYTGKRMAPIKEAYLATQACKREALFAKPLFEGWLPETKHDAINFLRLMLITRKSYDGATVLSFLIREAALGHTNPEGWIVQRIADAANHLAIEHSALATQIERLEKFGLVEVRRANGRYQAMRACLSGIHQALTEFDPSIVDQFVTPRVGLTRYLAQQEGLC